jgi:hypothetical protein
MKKIIALLAVALTLLIPASISAQLLNGIPIFPTGTPGPSYAFWSPCCTGTNITVSGAGRVAASNTASVWGTAQTAKSFLIKTYYEVTVTNVGTNTYIGIMVGTGPSNNPMNNIGRNYTFAWLNTGGIYDSSGLLTSGTPSFTTGDTLMFAVDPANHQWWIGKNGTWYNSGNPGTGVNPTNTTLNSSFEYSFAPTVSIYGAAGPVGSVTANFGQAAFTYTVPTGFQAGLY